MFKKTILMAISLVLIVGLAVGCSPPDTQVGGTFRWGVGSDPALMNPILYQDATSGEFIDRMFEGLIRYDENLERVPLLADSWDFADDFLSVTFYLKEGVLWHDGEPFTSEDVVFTFETMMHPDYPGVRASMFSTLESIVALDEHTVQFNLKEEFGPVMNNLGFNIIPKHIYSVNPENGEPWPIADLMDHPNNYDNVVGTGPFVWKEWKTGEYISFTRNENYHVEGVPYFEEFLMTIYGGLEAMMMALEVGNELDYGTIQADKVADMEKKGQNGDETYELITYDGLSYSYIGMNQKEGLFGEGNENFFQDLRVRQAIAHAAPIEDMIQNIYSGNAYRLHSSVPRSSWAYSEEGLTKYDYDLEAAAALLDEAGWELSADGFRYKNGQKLSFELATNASNQMRVDVITIMQDELTKIGVEVRLEAMEWQAFLDHVTKEKDAHAFVLGWNLAVDPDAYSIFHSAATSNNNSIYYANEEADYWIMKGRNSLDIEVRKEAYAELAKILSHDLPYVFLFAPKSVDAIRTGIEGYTVGQTGLFFMENWRYSNVEEAN
ncbi:hypothetical protein HYG86_13335 [Alkalicella caledoniensis]|uniref:Solute-binding protein family 5 domain-containing protein n=1 Tax=Alkalicella caledoniensis TaxID=2731377 RepID=A0A7G9WAH8_ALKCA|nr:ABC transporter substrate-binding protein [Alkalicella caledoniensis]QNO15690.1 hypothetical protein HYG86_13335 [Alkalicella caledoniensis]